MHGRDKRELLRTIFSKRAAEYFRLELTLLEVREYRAYHLSDSTHTLFQALALLFYAPHVQTIQNPLDLFYHSIFFRTNYVTHFLISIPNHTGYSAHTQ